MRRELLIGAGYLVAVACIVAGMAWWQGWPAGVVAFGVLAGLATGAVDRERMP